jgi:hypothetical protein
MWKAVTGVEGIPHGKYHAKGCMALRKREQFANDPLGKPGHTPLYVGLPSEWGSMDSDLMFFPIL